MRNERESTFRKVEGFCLELTLLVMLIIGLLRVIAPEVHDAVRILIEASWPTTTDGARKSSEGKVAEPVGLSDSR